MAEDTGEKKHQATERRLHQAREKGQVRRSNDLAKSALTLLLTLAVVGIGGLLAGGLYTWLRISLQDAGHISRSAVLTLDLGYAAALGGLLLIALGLSVVFGMLTGGWFFSLTALMPSLERISPGQSWQQILSISNLIEVLKSVIKIVVIAGTGLLAYDVLLPGFLSLATPRALSLGSLSASAFLVIAASVGGAAVLAGADVGMQMWLNRRTLRMTDQELREELRDAEGDPQLRARRRGLMRRLARARQQQSVKTASVMVTNPTHVAVALRYRKGTEAVPVVVAKGMDLQALPLLTEARRYGVPLVEAPPLARALHRLVELDQPIPPALYRPVAEILAYIWRLDQWRASGGDRPRRPSFPDTLGRAAESDGAGG